MKNLNRSAYFALAFLFSTSALSLAQASPIEFDHAQFSYGHSTLNSGYAAWNDYDLYHYFNIGGPTSPMAGVDNTTASLDHLLIETDYASHFDENAFVLGATYTHNYNDLWYQDFSASYSTDNFIYPGIGVFSELHRKLLADQALVAGLGVGYYLNQSPYQDLYFIADLTYYLQNGFSLGVGYRANRSNPGAVYSGRTFGILSYILERKLEAFIRVETGREGYTEIGPASFANEFGSTEEIAQVLYWWNTRFGAGVNLDFYQSDYYDRNGASLIFLFTY